MFGINVEGCVHITNLLRNEESEEKKKIKIVAISEGRFL
jgi:hypothetical protein